MKNVTSAPSLNDVGSTFDTQRKIKIGSALNKAAYQDLGDAIQDVGDVPELLSKVAPILVTLNVIGSVDFGITDPGLKVVQTLVLASSWLNAGRIIFKRYARVIEKNTFSFAYPDLKKGEASLSEIESLLTDGARGVYDMYNVPQKTTKTDDFTDVEWRQKLYSLDKYKKNIFEYATRNVTTTKDADFIWRVAISSPDPEIKLQAIKIISEKCKPFLKDIVSTKVVFGSQLEKAIVDRMKKDWWGITNNDLQKTSTDILENIAKKKQLENAQIIYDKISKNQNLPQTLVPLLKLFIVRKIRDEISKNNIPTSDNEDYIEVISIEFKKRMEKLQVLEKERLYSPEEATVGFEMQPHGSKNPRISVTKMDINDIKDLIQFAGLGWQNDMPFEIVFPPTRTPIVQTLMLAEACNLTGVPISEVGLQISFGGLTNEDNIKALQRMMVADGRLISDSNIATSGDSWNLGSAQKGEVNIREIGSGTVVITPEDLEHPEYKNVGEYRIPVGSKNFFTFYRGILDAHNLANAAKAFERGEKGYKLTETESKKASLFVQLIENFNQLCIKQGLPPIDSSWTKKNWMSYGKLMDSEIYKSISSKSENI